MTGVVAVARPRRVGPDWGLFFGRVSVFVVVLLVWWLVNVTGFISESVIPSMPGTVGEIVGLLGNGELWVAVGRTLIDAVIGLVIAAVIGIVAGVIIGAVPVLTRLTLVPVEFFRSFPSIALIPLAVLLLGPTAQMKIFMIVIAIVWPILVQTIHGVHRVDQTMSETVRAYQITRPRYFLGVLLPQSLPYVMTGLRIASTMSVLVAVAVEVITYTPGLGAFIRKSQEFGSTQLTFACVFYAAILGVLVNVSWRGLERRALRWYREQRSNG